MDIKELKERINGTEITNKAEITGTFGIVKLPYKSGAYEVMDIADSITGAVKTVIVNKNITENIKAIFEMGVTENEFNTILFNFKHINKKKDGSDYYLLMIAE